MAVAAEGLALPREGVARGVRSEVVLELENRQPAKNGVRTVFGDKLILQMSTEQVNSRN